MRTVTHSDALARFGYALSDATRTEILLMLRHGPGYPSDLAEKIGVSRQILSNHLACLRGCGLVELEVSYGGNGVEARGRMPAANFEGASARVGTGVA